ncbi:MAG: UDP-N-acetylglucosamine 2-epimerase, partial [bacterium]
MSRPLVVTIVGARPNFVKLGPVSRRLRASVREVIIHTGQHRDAVMSGRFFRDLRLPRPDVNLGVSGGTRRDQVARMRRRLEPILRRLKPDL